MYQRKVIHKTHCLLKGFSMTCFPTAKPSIKILAAYHKPATLIKDDICIPIQLGRAIEREPAFDGQLCEEDITWLHQNMMGDDTGDNISSQNRKYAELTAMYWAWKNFSALGNPDYIGLMHYRRNFTWQDIEKNLLSSDIILPLPVKLPCTLYEQYKKAHFIEDLELALTTLEKQKLLSKVALKKILQARNAYFFNMFIMKNNFFFQYCEWLFPILAEVDAQIDYSKRPGKNYKVLGFLAERLLNIFVAIHKQNCTIKTIPFTQDMPAQLSQKGSIKRKFKKFFRSPYAFYEDAPLPFCYLKHLFPFPK